MQLQIWISWPLKSDHNHQSSFYLSYYIKHKKSVPCHMAAILLLFCSEISHVYKCKWSICISWPLKPSPTHQNHPFTSLNNKVITHSRFTNLLSGGHFVFLPEITYVYKRKWSICISWPLKPSPRHQNHPSTSLDYRVITH